MTVEPRALCLVTSGLCPGSGFQDQKPSTQSQNMVPCAWSPVLSITAQLPVPIASIEDPGLSACCQAAHPAHPAHFPWQTTGGPTLLCAGPEGPGWALYEGRDPAEKSGVNFKNKFGWLLK